MLLYNRPGLSAPLLKIIADDASTSNLLELFFGNTRKSYFDSNGQFFGVSSSVGSTIVGGTLNSSSATFNLLFTPTTITAFGAAETLNVGPISGITGDRTLNLFTNSNGIGGQNTINIGTSSATLASTPQIINIGNATGVYNTITIGGSTDTALTLNATASVTGKITASSFYGNGSGLTSILGSNISGTVASATNSSSAGYAINSGSLGGITSSSYALQSYANSASLNAYNSASSYTAASAHNNTSASVGYAINSGSLGGITSSSYALQSYVNSASSNAYNSASTYTQSSAWNNTSASVKYASSAGFVLGSNISGTVASATNSSSAGYSSSVGSTIIGGTLDSSTTPFTLLATPNTVTAFSAAGSITIGYQTNGTSIVNIGSTSNTIGTKTLNLFTNLAGTAGQNTINIGSSGATLGSTPQVINIGNATGAYNTITIGGSTDTILNINATASVTGNISASTISLSSSITATSASFSGKINASSVVATQVTGGGMDLIYSGTVTSTSGSVLIDNIFSSSYANYRVLFTTTSNGSSTSIYFKYASAGVPSSSALYTYNMLSNATAIQTSNSGSVLYHSVGAYATGATHAFEFYGPALTTTHMYKMEIYDSYSGGPTQQTVRGSYTNSSSFSGIVLGTQSTGATFNGTVRVYGYHN
jgi:epidermal growth factor receptor substrate 15